METTKILHASNVISTKYTGQHQNSTLGSAPGLKNPQSSDTLCHMKSISIRELHHNTGEWIRKAAQVGEIHVTQRGKTIARILPQTPVPEVPYFARRKLSPQFRRIMHRLRGGIDSTQIISEDRDRPIE
jgi:antitoxin (DNA-binding transcriptional repressor) of toxin-antitoxin stability system